MPNSTVGKYSGGIPCNHPPKPRSEIHQVREDQLSEWLIRNSPVESGGIYHKCLVEPTINTW